MIYKFKITFENQDEFYREIEIKSTQLFTDFHNCLTESVKIDNNESAAFYICSDNWLKETKITSETIRKTDDEDEEDTYKRKRKKIEEYQLNESILKDFIYDPHQKLIYESNLQYPRTFYIELIKITQEEKNTKYPVCTNKNGELPPIIQKKQSDLKKFDTPAKHPCRCGMDIPLTDIHNKLSALDDIDDIPEDFVEEDLDALLNEDLSNLSFDDDISISIKSTDTEDEFEFDELDEDNITDDDEFSPRYGDSDPYNDDDRF